MSEMKLIDFDVASLAGGAIAEQLEEAVREVVENLLDPNTDHKPARTITLKLTFKQNLARTAADVTAAITKGLAPHAPAATSIRIGTDLITGDVLASEITQTQLSFEDLGYMAKEA